MQDDENDPELRSFGRRRGRIMSARQQQLLAVDLPCLSIDLSLAAPPRLETLFEAPVEDVWLEVGFGGGEHLLWQSERHPEIGHIGCEPFLDGVVKVVDAVSGASRRNVRVHPDDARPLLRWLPAKSIGRVFVLFPDPWPKRRHHKRRLISPPFLDLLARVMKPGAELRIGTDIPDYVRTTMLALLAHSGFEWPARSPKDWQIRPSDWPSTRYEQKAIREGRRPVYLMFRRTG